MTHSQLSKTMQAVSTLLRNDDSKQMSYLRLLKLLYIADRESIRETGHAITGDRVIAMERGPVLNGVYDLIRGQHLECVRWSEFFRKVGYRLVMVQDPGVGSLSKFDIQKLNEVSAKYRDLDEWALVEVTHSFPEWIKNDPGQSSRSIPLRDILEAVGQSANEGAILQEKSDFEIFDRLFAETEG